MARTIEVQITGEMKMPESRPVEVRIIGRPEDLRRVLGGYKDAAPSGNSVLDEREAPGAGNESGAGAA